MIRAALVFSLTFVFAAASLAAREFTTEEKAGLATAVAAFDQAMTERDWANVMAVVPPRVLERFASDGGLSVEDFLARLAETMEEALDEVTFESYGMDLDQTQYAETEDGTPYALIPTFTVVDLGEAGGRVRSENTTLGMLDEGRWYLVRAVDDTTLATLKALYPSFAEIEIPPGTMEIVEQ